MTEQPHQDLSALPTPAAVVDLDRMHANLRRMQSYVDGHALRLRPHNKTHKARWLAAEQVALGAAGITVATPAEADALGDAAPEVLIAHPPLGPRAAQVARLAARGSTLVALDSVEAVQALRGALERAGDGTEVGVLVEANMGMDRVGVGDPDAALRIARACGEGAEYRGLLFYPGHVRQPVREQDAALESLSGRLDAFVQSLGDAGYEPEIVSGGSTPTAFRSHEIAGVTEIRPGTYVFNDRTTAGIDACAWDDCAYTVLATVVSTAVAGQAVVDAGSKALSSDAIRAPGLVGYGQLLDRPDVFVARLSEEHGVLELSRSEWRPRVGERVRIIPNHVCVSVNLHERVWGVRGERVERAWPVQARGRWTAHAPEPAGAAAD